MAMDLAPGGELLSLITAKQNEKLDAGIENEACDVATTQFYMAEIIEAVEYLHSRKIIHRDLKPESKLKKTTPFQSYFINHNPCSFLDVLLSATGHVKVTDFGTSTIEDDQSNSPRNSFVGTQDYVSPEVLSGEKVATKACDLWALGCMVYQMLSGISPFRGGTEYLTFENIMGHCKGNQPLTFPAVISADAQDLILKLLKVNDAERLGAGDDSSVNSYAVLKAHPFFESVPWGELEHKQAPFTPDASTFPSDEVMHDGSSDEWLMEGEATPIVTSTRHSLGCASTVTVNMDSIDVATPSNNAKWEVFLKAPERRVFTGLIYKRKVCLFFSYCF